VNGFEEVVGGDILVPGEVGEGAGDFQESIMCSRGEVQLMQGVFEQFAAGVIELGMGFHDAGRHGGVAADVGFFREARCLYGAGGFDAGADAFGRFAGVAAVEVAEFKGRHFDVDVDAVEERAAEPLAIRAELVRGAAALAFRVGEITAGGRITAEPKRR